MQHERLGGPVGEQSPAGAVAPVAAQRDAAPLLPAPAQLGADPAVALAAPGLAGDALPVAQHVVDGRPLPRRGQHAVGEVGDDDGAAAVPGDLVEQPLQRGAGRDQPGEGGAHRLRQADGGELAPHQPGLHLLGQLGEGERAVQDDHGQPAPLGGPAHGVRRRGERPAEAEDHGRRLGAVQGPHVLGLPALVPGEQDARGEHHLAAAEHHADVGGLGDVHPAHRPVQLRRPGHHLRFPGQDPLHGQDLADRQRVQRFGASPGIRRGRHDGSPSLPWPGAPAGRRSPCRATACSAGRPRGSRRPPRPPRRSGTAAARRAARWCRARRPCR